MQVLGPRMLYTASRTQDPGPRTQDLGTRIRNLRFRAQTLGSSVLDPTSPLQPRDVHITDYLLNPGLDLKSLHAPGQRRNAMGAINIDIIKI